MSCYTINLYLFILLIIITTLLKMVENTYQRVRGGRVDKVKDLLNIFLKTHAMSLYTKYLCLQIDFNLYYNAILYHHQVLLRMIN